MTFNLDDHTPVVVGAGQVSERLDDPGYLGRPPVELAAAAALAALADTGADAAQLASLIDTVAATRLFDESFPGGRSPLGRTDNLPRSVARRIGADPLRAVLEVSGGQSPQHLVTEFAGEIAAGRSEACLIVGAEAISTGQALARTAQPPNWDEQVAGDVDDRGIGVACNFVAERWVADGGMLKETAMAKNTAVATCDRVVHEAVLLFGGLGCMRESEVERHYRDARVLGIGGGTTEIMNEIIAKLMGL